MTRRRSCVIRLISHSEVTGPDPPYRDAGPRNGHEEKKQIQRIEVLGERSGVAEIPVER